MAVERLDVVLRRGHVFDERHETVNTLEWSTVPGERGGGAIELGQLAETRRRVIRGIVDASEIVRCACGDFDTREVE
jgi:hypothetical protein